jgi:glucarate dehydratase
MKGPIIKEFSVTPIAVTDPPLLNAAGLHAPYALRTVLELITDDGISGISEIPGNLRTNEALIEACSLLIGQDPFQLGAIRRDIDQHFGEPTDDRRGLAPWDQRKLVHVFSSIEVACLDIQGKVAEKPVVDLLGGKVRERVPYAAYLFYKYEGAGGALEFETDPNATGWSSARQAEALTSDQIVAQAKAMCKEFGFRSLKLKGGVYEPKIEVEALLALRREFPHDVPIRFDPNALWEVDTAIAYGKQLEAVLEYFEDPVRGQPGMGKVRRALNIPLATNMCTTSFADIPSSIELGSEDIILSDHHFWGGLKASMVLAGICDTFGRSLSMHSNSHLGISLTAMTHLGAALPHLTYALDTHYPWQSEEIIEGGRVKFEEGAVQVPDGPGLGITLDRVALQRLHENYLTCGLTERNDEIEMQKKIPGWKFKPVRW